MVTIDSYEYDDIQGQHHEVILEKDGHDRWNVHCFKDNEHIWSVNQIPGSGHLFTSEEAHAEFERWRPSK